MFQQDPGEQAVTSSCAGVRCVYVLGVVTMCNIARSLAHVLVSAALSVTALCCDHPHALKWSSLHSFRQGRDVGGGVWSYIGRTEARLRLGRARNLAPKVSWAVKLLHLARSLG